MFDTTVGVSVTRAMKKFGEFEMEDAYKLLYKKLNGMVDKSNKSIYNIRILCIEILIQYTFFARIFTR